MDRLDKSLPGEDMVFSYPLRGAGGGTTLPTGSMAEDKRDPKMLRMVGEFYMRGQGTDPDPVKGMQYFNEAVDAGSVEALWDIAQCYVTGRGVEADISKSVPFLQRGADAGDPDAMYLLGNWFLCGMKGVAKDISKAVALFQKAADLGLAEACVELGELYVKGKGVPIDEEKAIPLFLKVVNDPKIGWQAQRNLSEFYMLGTRGLQRDVKKGLSYLRKAVEKGDAEGWLRLGRCYDLGLGVEQDAKKAVEIYQSGTEGGCGTAMYGLAEHYLRGEGVPLDQEKAISLLQDAVEMGDRQALWRLGRCYDSGEGVKKDVEKAVELYRRSAERGYAQAMYDLSKHYMKADGVTFDPKQGISLLERASGGYTPALRKLASYYKKGKGVDKDIRKAISLLNKAADAGDHQAIVDLSTYYITGADVPVDFTHAVSLLERAYKMGNPVAGMALGWGLLMGAYEMKRDVNRAFPILKHVAEYSSAARAMLALCYEYGFGVHKDVSKANAMYQETIDEGFAASLFLVGENLELGTARGPKDMTKAYQFYARAACAGHQGAQKKLFSLLGYCLYAFMETTYHDRHKTNKRPLKTKHIINIVVLTQ
ncbi:sel1 repeat family protein [Pelomyxa schiedti]|nr:sel1 repeat family protein [Pelomyxa schiedti]